MQGHQSHIICRFVQAVDVGDQGDLLQEIMKACLLCLLLIENEFIHKLIDVLDPGLGLIGPLGLKSLHIAGPVYEIKEAPAYALLV